MSSERTKEYEAMVQRWIDTGESDMQISDRDVTSLIRMLEMVSDRERETWGPIIDKKHRFAYLMADAIRHVLSDAPLDRDRLEALLNKWDAS